MSPTRLDELDDRSAVRALDPDDMLANVGSAGAQVRQALQTCEQIGMSSIVESGQPRAVVVAGMGGSGIAGHVLQAVAGPDCPIPVERVRGWGLPAWVSADDLVIAVSSSGRTAETTACLDIALQRRSRVVVVAAADSPMAEMASANQLPWFPVPGGRPPRANLWALSVPLLLAANALGIVSASPADLAAVADLLDGYTAQCRVDVPSQENPAKQLAGDLLGRLPMIWGSSDVAGIAAYRLLCQFAENAKTPSVHGVLPEALHNQIVIFDGPHGGADDPNPVHLLMLRDTVEHPHQSVAADAAEALARRQGIAVSTVRAVGSHPLQRMASMVAVGDFASVYLGLLRGVDPTPITPIEALKASISG